MKTTNRLSWKYVRDEIHHEILSGRYGPGDRLPRDADIADQLVGNIGVTWETVTRSIAPA